MDKLFAGLEFSNRKFRRWFRRMHPGEVIPRGAYSRPWYHLHFRERVIIVGAQLECLGLERPLRSRKGRQYPR